MKKISLFMLSLFVAATMSATIVTFDFTDPTSLGITPSSTTGEGVSLADDTITVGAVAMSFSVPSGNGAKLWTAKGPAYNLRFYQPSSMILTSSGDNIRGIRVTRTQGDITELDANNEWRGDAKSVTLSVPDKGKANYISMVKVYVGEEMPSGIDTISVSEARQRIAEKNFDPCYIKGVVSKAPFIITLSSKDNYCTWLTDPENPQDSIEAFNMRKGKDAKSTYASLDEMAQDFGLMDTVLIYAEALATAGAVYETTAGYYVETLGKSPKTNGNAIFKYGVGAVQCGMAYDGVRYKYEVVLSKVDEEDFDNAVHMVINSAKEKGIAGKYTIKNYQNDTSYVNREDGGKDLIEGSLQLTYLEPDGMYSKYTVKATFMLGGVSCIIDTTYKLAGWTSDHDPFLLKDDVPYKPKPGDTLTCAQAASYAASLGSATGDTVYVRGFVTGFQKITGRAQQSPYMADDKTATQGVFQAYLGYTQNRDSIVAGDEIIVYGPVSYYAAQSKCQIQKGQIYRIGGSNTQRPVETEEVPADAISVADAIAMGAKLAERDTTEEVTVKGYVTKLYKTFNGMYSSQSFYIDDQPFEEGKFYTMEAFQSQIAVAAVVGDYVFVKGRITKYEPTSSSAARRDAAEVSYNIVNSVTKFAELTTGLEQVKQVATKSGARKVMMNGQMFILKDGVLYNALGAQVQ